MPELSNFLDTTSIEVFYQIAGVLTERILANCLYKIEDPFEINEIVISLNRVIHNLEDLNKIS